MRLGTCSQWPCSPQRNIARRPKGGRPDPGIQRFMGQGVSYEMIAPVPDRTIPDPIRLALGTDCGYAVHVQSPVLNRAEAVQRLSAVRGRDPRPGRHPPCVVRLSPARTDARRQRCRRLGPVRCRRQDLRPLLRVVRAARTLPGPPGRVGDDRRLRRSSDRVSWRKRKMSFESRDYLRHILVEADYLVERRLDSVTPVRRLIAFYVDATQPRGAAPFAVSRQDARDVRSAAPGTRC